MKEYSYALIFLVVIFVFAWCNKPAKPVKITNSVKWDTSYAAEHITEINTGKTTPEQLVAFACSLEGTPYRFGSIDPKQGFDCSGFVTYVFHHFGIAVPRTSVDFTPVHHEIDLKDARLGDLILFTGTDSTIRIVGHMGIVSSIPGEALEFIHSTSGKAQGVVETPFNQRYYKARYVKTIRIFPQNYR